MQNGWALQSGTSHFLGQNFARAFDVYFQTAENEQARHRRHHDSAAAAAPADVRGMVLTSALADTYALPLHRGRSSCGPPHTAHQRGS